MTLEIPDHPEELFENSDDPSGVDDEVLDQISRFCEQSAKRAEALRVDTGSGSNTDGSESGSNADAGSSAAADDPGEKAGGTPFVDRE